MPLYNNYMELMLMVIEIIWVKGYDIEEILIVLILLNNFVLIFKWCREWH